jgi:hypothetical protein
MARWKGDFDSAELRQRASKEHIVDELNDSFSLAHPSPGGLCFDFVKNPGVG